MEHLDTRPQERAAQAKARVEDLRGEIRWLCSELLRLLGTDYAEGVRLKLQLAVEEQERAWTWRLAWNQVEVRRC